MFYQTKNMFKETQYVFVITELHKTKLIFISHLFN